MIEMATAHAVMSLAYLILCLGCMYLCPVCIQPCAIPCLVLAVIPESLGKLDTKIPGNVLEYNSALGNHRK